MHLKFTKMNLISLKYILRVLLADVVRLSNNTRGKSMPPGPRLLASRNVTNP